MESIRIRNGTVGDGPALARLLGSLGYPGTEDFIEDKVTQAAEHPDARLLVAEAGRQVIGFLSLHFIPQVALAGDFCRISYFCVLDSYRNRGIGAALEERAATLANERGCDRIEVHCHSRREEAHRFYHRQGYEESPRYLVKSIE